MSSSQLTDSADHLAIDHATEITRVGAGAVRTRRPLPELPGYELLCELGRGGMGVVYLARDRRLGRLVAIKMILGGGAASEENLARFRTEAQAIAALRHPGIVQIYETGELDGLPYFTLEYCGGGTLEQRLRDGPLPPRRAAELIRAVAEAVAAAHDAGIIHRDLKPSNILLEAPDHRSADARGGMAGSASAEPRPADPDRTSASGKWDVPKVGDFGLAKRSTESNLTATGLALGTPSYMAPEQANAVRDIGPATDVHALGAVLYECLTGRPPFLGSDQLDTLLQVRFIDPVPPSRFQPGMPADLETICLKCLAKDPARRYGRAGDLAADLGRWLEGRPIVARPIGPLERCAKWARRRPALAAALAAALFMLAAGSVVSTFFAVRATAQADRAERAGRQLRRQLADAHLDRGLDLADQGKIAEGLHWMFAALRELDGDGETEFERVVRVNLAEWGRLVPAVRRFVSLRPGRDSAQPSFLTVSPDGQTLAIGYRLSGVELWDLPELRQRPERFELPFDSYACWLAFRPDGRQLAIAVCCTGGQPLDTDGVYLWDMKTPDSSGPPLRVPGTPPAHLSYRADGRELAVGYRGEAPAIWDLASRRIRLRLDWPGLLPTTRAQFTRATYLPDGRSLVCTLSPAGDDGGSKFWHASADDGTIRGAIQASPKGLLISQTAPDGRTYPVLRRSEGLRLIEMGTGQELAHRNLSGDGNVAVYSPDGQRMLTSNGQRIEILESAGLRSTAEPLPQTDRVCAFGWYQNGTRIVAIADDGMFEYLGSPPAVVAAAGTVTVDRRGRALAERSRDSLSVIGDRPGRGE